MSAGLGGTIGGLAPVDRRPATAAVAWRTRAMACELAPAAEAAGVGSAADRRAADASTAATGRDTPATAAIEFNGCISVFDVLFKVIHQRFHKVC